MVPTVSQLRDELADREAIRDCLYRYSRGTDRIDAELLRSVYWPGALDHHTGFDGTAEGFIEWAIPRLAAFDGAVHMMGNSLIRIEGNTAKVETYFWSGAVAGEPAQRVVVSGRYVDRFEKRNDEWRIAERWVVHDYFEQGPSLGDWRTGPFGMAGLLRGGVHGNDHSQTWLGL